MKPRSSDRFSPLLIAGPTAVGKSAVALLAAERLGGEIISVDSMQVYRGLDIGTAKPTPAERARVPHHLMDVVSLTQPFDAAQFADLARRITQEIQARGRVPILCGGTGLYFKAYLEGLGQTPPSDPVLRAGLEAMPLADLLRELELKAPAAFAAIDRQNPRRVVRAVEILRLTGQPLAQLRSAGAKPDFLDGCMFVALQRNLTDLRARIDRRVEAMFLVGLVDETRRLLELGLADNRAALQAIGYRQVFEYLRGERSLPDTIELVKIRTRQFAKRQMTWFRGQAAPAWIELAENEDAETTCHRLLGLYSQRDGNDEGRRQE